MGFERLFEFASYWLVLVISRVPPPLPPLPAPYRLNIDAAQTSTVPTRMPQAQSLAAADAALIAAWQGGDEQAAAELVRRHARALARFLAAGGAPEADLDDLVQETFIRALRAAPRFRGQRSEEQRPNSSHSQISDAVFSLYKKNIILGQL